MSGVLLIAQFILAVLIVLIVLMQKSSSIGLGAYSGSNETLFGAKGPAAFLAKATAFLGLLFVINTVTLTYMYYSDRSSSIMDSVVIPAGEEKSSAPEAPKAN